MKEPCEEVKKVEQRYEKALDDMERHYKDVLDNIRAEIEQITDTMGVSYNQYVSKIDVLQIIDKYKAESEEDDYENPN